MCALAHASGDNPRGDKNIIGQAQPLLGCRLPVTTLPKTLGEIAILPGNGELPGDCPALPELPKKGYPFQSAKIGRAM